MLRTLTEVRPKLALGVQTRQLIQSLSIMDIFQVKLTPFRDLQTIHHQGQMWGGRGTLQGVQSILARIYI